MFVLNYSLTRKKKRVREKRNQHKTKKITGRQTTRSHKKNQKKKKEKKKEPCKLCVCDSVYRRLCVHVHNDRENTAKMTSMYINTHLTAKRSKWERWHAQCDDHVNNNNNIKKAENKRM